MFNRKTVFALVAVLLAVGVGYLLAAPPAITQGQKPKPTNRTDAKAQITYLNRADTPVAGVRIISTGKTESGGISITLQNVSAKPVSFVSLFFWERNGVTSALPLPFYGREGGALEPGETYTHDFGEPDVPTLAALVYSDGTVEGGGQRLKEAIFFHNTYLNAQKRYLATISAGKAKGNSADLIAGQLRSQAATEAVTKTTRNVGSLRAGRDISFALSEGSGNELIEAKIEKLRRKFETIQSKTQRTQEEAVQTQREF
ncbi:MAG TPA: hypothetical protein VIQ24_14530 [Pyrinomonadaceae bacterium]